MKKFILTAVAAGIISAGCTGPFALTQKLHTWQTSFDEKWVDEVAFLGCVILPAYGLATFGDAVIFNSVEFWTGDNPMDTVSIDQDGQTAKIAYLEDGKVKIETEAGRVLFLEKSNNGVVATDAKGNLLYTSTTSGNNVEVTDASGALVKSYERSL